MGPLRRTARLGRQAVQPLVAFLWPTACFGCGEPLALRQHRGSCPACWAGLRPMPRPQCPGCALPRPPATDLLGPWRGRCAACRTDPPAADRVQAAVAYDELARAFVLRAKLGRRPELYDAIGRRLARAVEVSGIARDCTAVVPVPSGALRTWRRGFTPALELARPVARSLRLPVRRALRRRLAAGPPTKRLRAAPRKRIARDAFRARRSAAGHRVLLVDDVMTTGATLEACVRALRDAGAERVVAAVWARTF